MTLAMFIILIIFIVINIIAFIIQMVNKQIQMNLIRYYYNYLPKEYMQLAPQVEQYIRM